MYVCGQGCGPINMYTTVWSALPIFFDRVCLSQHWRVTKLACGPGEDLYGNKHVILFARHGPFQSNSFTLQALGNCVGLVRSSSSLWQRQSQFQKKDICVFDVNKMIRLCVCFSRLIGLLCVCFSRLIGLVRMHSSSREMRSVCQSEPASKYFVSL